MKILVFGDVHGNLISLEQLFDIERNNFDRFVCHGDIVNYGPWSNECVQFLLNQDNGTLLKGNHEEYYIEGKYPGNNDVARTFFSFCYPAFDKKLVREIDKFEYNVDIECFNFRHSLEGRYIFNDTDISDLQFVDNTVIGHSHQQFQRSIDGRNLYNTGSLGQNRTILNVAQYLMIDTEKKLVVNKEFVYDISQIYAEMKKSKYPKICIDYYLSKRLV